MEPVVERGICALCNHREARPLFSVDGQGLSVVECRECGLAYLDPRVRPDDIEQLYPPAYYGPEGQRFKWGLEALVAFFRRRRARRIERIVPKGRLLDVGCGRGLFLSFLQERGWEVSGTEISAQAARQARDRFGLTVFTGPLTALRLPDRTYDMVTLWHVLEHIPDPGATLREIHRITQEGGWLIVAVPNLASWQAKLARGHWYHLDPPRHYYFYTPRTLERLLQLMGFQVVAIRHFSLEHNFHAFFHSIFNLLGFSRNLTCEALRVANAKREAGAGNRRSIQTLLSLLLALPVACLALGVCIAESLFRRGGTIEVYARKVSYAHGGGPPWARRIASAK